MTSQGRISIGKVSGVFGIKGWLKVFSYTEPKTNILNYKEWALSKGSVSKTVKVIAGQAHGSGVIVQFEGVTDRESAQLLIGFEAEIAREQLPQPEQGEYYWTDLIGLTVENLEGVQLGEVETLFETGANDVLVVKGEKERAIPFLQDQVIKSIDLKAQKMIVDWDAEF